MHDFALASLDERTSWNGFLSDIDAILSSFTNQNTTLVVFCKVFIPLAPPTPASPPA
jgi:aromatic ring hydroxylase